MENNSRTNMVYISCFNSVISNQIIMNPEDKIRLEIRSKLLEITDNRATVILIESMILDYRVAVYERAFKEASEIMYSTFDNSKNKETQ